MIEFLIDQFSMVYMMIFLLAFMPMAFSRRKSIILCIFVFFVYMGLDYICIVDENIHMPIIANTILQTLLFQSLAVVLCKYKDFRGLFTGLTAVVWGIFGNCIGMFFSMYINSMFVPVFVACLINLLVLLVLLRFFRVPYFDILEEKGIKWEIFCVIPILFYLCCYSLLKWPSSLEDNPKNVVGLILIFIVMIFSYVLIFKTSGTIRKLKIKEEYENYIVRYTDSLNRQIEIMNKSNEKTAIMRHDLKHLMIIMKEFVRCKEYEKLEETIKEFLNHVKEATPIMYCSSIPINAVLSQYVENAADLNVKLTITVRIKDLKCVNDIELSMVISNLLGNALREAVKVEDKERFINATIRNVKEQLLISIENSFDGYVKFDKSTGFPISERGDNHGWGYKSINTFTEKYQAIFDFSVENNVFQVNLLIPKP